MDFEKLHTLSCTLNTWCVFLHENTVITSNFACMLSNESSNEDYILRLYKNEFYYLKTHMEELIEKYEKLENFCNENRLI
jgi:hypothetical protein